MKQYYRFQIIHFKVIRFKYVQMAALTHLSALVRIKDSFSTENECAIYYVKNFLKMYVFLNRRDIFFRPKWFQIHVTTWKCTYVFQVCDASALPYRGNTRKCTSCITCLLHIKYTDLLETIWKHRYISRRTKTKRLMKKLMFWRCSRVEQKHRTIAYPKRINAFRMWLYRCTLRRRRIYQSETCSKHRACCLRSVFKG